MRSLRLSRHKGLVLVAGDLARVDAHLVLAAKAVQGAPLSGRNFIQLVMLAAGVNEGTQASFSSGTRPDDRRATSSYSANGSTDSVNNNRIGWYGQQ